MKSLFTPGVLAGRRLSNRILMAPMTRARIKDTVPDEKTALYYAQRASAGLIVSECIAVSPQAMGSLFLPGLWTDAQVQGWEKVTKAVYEKGGTIFAQIWHPGRVSHAALHKGDAPVAPTDKPITATDVKVLIPGENGKPQISAPSAPRGLRTEEMPKITQDFVKAAGNALKAGFDGIEIHAANGYLFEQFFNPLVNDRADKYGGSLPNRLRFFFETLEALVDAYGAARVGVRLSPFGTRMGMPSWPRKDVVETYLNIGRILNRYDLAYVHFNDVANDKGVRDIPETFLRSFRDAYNGTIALAGSLTRHEAERLMNTGAGWSRRGLIDFAAFGRAYIANPDLVERLRNNWPLAEADMSTFFGGDDKGYTDYPAYVPPPAPPKKQSAFVRPQPSMPPLLKNAEQKAQGALKPVATVAPKPDAKAAEKRPAPRPEPKQKPEVTLKAPEKPAPKPEVKPAEVTFPQAKPAQHVKPLETRPAPVPPPTPAPAPAEKPAPKVEHVKPEATPVAPKPVDVKPVDVKPVQAKPDPKPEVTPVARPAPKPAPKPEATRVEARPIPAGDGKPAPLVVAKPPEARPAPLLMPVGAPKPTPPVVGTPKPVAGKSGDPKKKK